MGEEPNRTTAGGLVLYKSYYTLYAVRSKVIEEGNTQVSYCTSYFQGAGSLCRLYSTNSTLAKNDTVALLFFAFFKN